MSDLRSEADSLGRASTRMTHGAGALDGPAKAFATATGDLSAFGALGSLLKATGEIQQGMTNLDAIVRAMHAEWDAEAAMLTEVGKVFDGIDRLLAAQAKRG